MMAQSAICFALTFMLVADKAIASGACYSAYTPHYNCQGYENVGYHCVNGYCAAMNPGGDPSVCAAKSPDGYIVSYASGTCIPGPSVQYTDNSCALSTSTAYCSPCNPNGGCGSLKRDCAIFDSKLDYNCCADGNADCNEVLVEPATPGPTTNPTPGPTTDPTPGPTTNLTPGPTTNPTPGPTTNLTPGPTTNPTPGPTTNLTPGPTTNLTPGPTTNPTPGPTTNLTPGPTTNLTPGPTTNPTPGPTTNLTPGPTTNRATTPEILWTCSTMPSFDVNCSTFATKREVSVYTRALRKEFRACKEEHTKQRSSLVTDGKYNTAKRLLTYYRDNKAQFKAAKTKLRKICKIGLYRNVYKKEEAEKRQAQEKAAKAKAEAPTK